MVERQEAQVVPSGPTWEELVNVQKLDAYRPEDVAAAIRHLPVVHSSSVRGRLLDHLRSRAQSYLTPRVDKNLPDGGRGAIKNVVDGMVDALLDANSTDGPGYAIAFNKKLRERLTDQVRKLRRDQQRFPEPAVDREDGEAHEPTHPSDELTPEEAAIAAGIIQSLPERHRKALALYRQGYRCSDAEGGETISSMMNVSIRTAEQWIRDVRKAVRIKLEMKP